MKKEEATNVFDPAFDLKQTLVQDNSGLALEAVCAAFREGHLTLNKAMAAGLPRNEYQAALNLKEALNAAEDTVNDYWRKQHPNN